MGRLGNGRMSGRPDGEVLEVYVLVAGVVEAGHGGNAAGFKVEVEYQGRLQLPVDEEPARVSHGDEQQVVPVSEGRPPVGETARTQFGVLIVSNAVGLVRPISRCYAKATSRWPDSGIAKEEPVVPLIVRGFVNSASATKSRERKPLLCVPTINSPLCSMVPSSWAVAPTQVVAPEVLVFRGRSGPLAAGVSTGDDSYVSVDLNVTQVEGSDEGLVDKEPSLGLPERRP